MSVRGARKRALHGRTTFNSLVWGSQSRSPQIYGLKSVAATAATVPTPATDYGKEPGYEASDLTHPSKSGHLHGNEAIKIMANHAVWCLHVLNSLCCK